MSDPASWAGAIGGVAGAFGGGGGGGGGKAPIWAGRLLDPASRMMLSAAQRNPRQAIAGFNPDQLRAMQMVRNNMGIGQPLLEKATNRVNQLAKSGVTPDMIKSFFNPYEQSAVRAVMRDINHSRKQRQLGISAEAEAAGAFGGDREAVYRAITDDNFDRTAASTAAQMRNEGYQNATNSAFQNLGMQMAGNKQLMDLIEARRQAMFGDAGALAGIGDIQQQQEQRYLDYPIDMATKMINLGGVGYGVPSGGGGGGGDSLSDKLQGFVGGVETGGKIWDILKDLF